MDGEHHSEVETTVIPRPGDIIIDDEDDDDEEVIFIITTDLLSGHRRNKSKSTTNRDSGCSYDSEVSSGISDKDKSLSPAFKSTRSANIVEKNANKMGSTATSCQYAVSNTQDSNLDSNKSNAPMAAKIDIESKEFRNGSITGERSNNADDIDGCDPGGDESDLNVTIINGTNDSVENGSKLEESDDKIEVDYVNVCEHMPFPSNKQEVEKTKNQNHNIPQKASSEPPVTMNLQDELNNAMNEGFNRSQSETIESPQTPNDFKPTLKTATKSQENGNVKTPHDHVDSSHIKVGKLQVGESPSKMPSSEIKPKVGDRRITQSKGNKISDATAVKTVAQKGKAPSAGISRGAKKSVYTFDEAVEVLKEYIQTLVELEDYTKVNGRAELKFVRRSTRYSSDLHLRKRLVDSLVKHGIIHVFLRVWKSVSTVDFMDYTKNAHAFKNLQTALSIIWNCSDKSVPLCESLVRSGALLSFVDELGSDRVSCSDLSHENNLYLVKAYLGILHNVVRLTPESKSIVRTKNAVKILQWYLISKNDLIKTNAYLVLSYIITEEENDIINANDDNIQFIIGVLEDALNSENHYSKKYGFWATEVVYGLYRLAFNDSNKIRIGAYGAIPFYMRLLRDGSWEEKEATSSALWMLAFKDENKVILHDDAKYMEVLSKLTVPGVPENIRRSVRFTLWYVHSLQERPAAQTIEDADIPHVMVSYHHKSGQRMMLKVVRLLRNAGFKVWMDVDDMHGSTLEAMALAIERSCCILVFMTQGYKDSPSCRTEAEYAYRLRKDIIPLLGQDGYVPDGWLGAFVGSRLHFDFSADEKIQLEIQKVVRELGARGKLPTRKIGDRRSWHTSSDSFDGLTLSTSWSTCSSSGHSYHQNQKQRASQWSTDEVRSWLESHLLGHIHDRFETLNGELILQLKAMQSSAPEFFYNTLEHKLKFDLVTILKFTRALEDVS